ncbi:MAG TPA: BTAD domain-containing putative transcriptional regulator [Conexibacter sp.]
MERFEQASLEIQLLGGFAVSVGGRPVAEQAWRLRRAKSLVKLLALAPERRLHREQATELLWPGREPAANALHQVLYTARRAVAGDGGRADGHARVGDGRAHERRAGGEQARKGQAADARADDERPRARAAERLVLRDDVVALVGDGISVDVDRFELAAAVARRVCSVSAYQRALNLYAGELLPEDRYEDWTWARRDALRETRLGLLIALAEAHVNAGDDAPAVEALQRVVVEDPVHEPAHRALMRLFADGGRQQQALAQYQSLRDALGRMLAADPDPETRRLYHAILASQHAPAPTREPANRPAPSTRDPWAAREPANRTPPSTRDPWAAREPANRPAPSTRDARAAREPANRPAPSTRDASAAREPANRTPPSTRDASAAREGHAAAAGHAAPAGHADAPLPDQMAANAATGLPRQLTSFVGRARELAVLDRLLDRARLLTLTGPGGCGKSRLGLELAARRAAESLDGGTHAVDLAPISDPALVVEEAAAALGVTPRSERDPVELLGDQIGDARVLLILDNCEHLIDACASLADRLLRRSPNLRLLATSREPLRVDGEVAWRVPPLSLPELPERGGAGAARPPSDNPSPDPAWLDDLSQSEAIRLFCQRAEAAAPGFALSRENAAAVAEVCRRLDGMPLALELAAARITVLSPAQIAERLGDALALLRGGSRTGLTRQQTLRATLAWSHDLLTDAERVLYRRLGVFAGSFGVEAIDGVCTDDDGLCAGGVALDLLAQLADKSLVQVDPGAGHYRYRLLETVRQHAREKLAEAGEKQEREAAHRAWYLALAAAADRDLAPEVAAAWPAERLEAEHDDLRAALASAIRDDPPSALELASHLWWFWMARGLFVEGSRWLDEALGAAPEPTAARARALWSLGGIDVRRRGTIRTVSISARALGIARGAADSHAEARALERRGGLAMGGFDWPIADRALAEGLALARDLGDASVTVAITQAQGVLAGCRGETAVARELLYRALGLLDEIPDERGPLFWAMHIAPITLPAGPAGAPRLFFEDTFCLFRAVRSRAGAAYALLNVGEAWRIDGDHSSARAAIERALARFRAIGDDQGAAVALTALGNTLRTGAVASTDAHDPAGDGRSGSDRSPSAAADLAAATAAFEEALALRRAARDTREIATAQLGMGMLELYAGDEERGRALLEAVRGTFERSEDGPGLQAIPLDLGGFELDHGDPRRAAALLAQCAELSRTRRIVPNLAWSLAERGEALAKVGEPTLARRSLAEALALFTGSSDGRGARYARGLLAQLEDDVSPSVT